MKELIIEESDSKSNELKLGKSLFILLNDSKEAHARVQLAEEESVLDGAGSMWRAALDCVDRALALNAADTADNVMESMVSRYMEISASKPLHVDLVMGAGAAVALPQHYFKTFRLFKYMISAHAPLVFQQLRGRLDALARDTEDKAQKKSVLDLLVMCSNFFFIYLVNPKQGAGETSGEDLVGSLSSLSEVVRVTAVQSNNTVTPTRLSAQSSDVLLVLSQLFISTSLKNNTNHNNELILSFFEHLVAYFGLIKNWYRTSKPGLFFAINMLVSYIGAFRGRVSGGTVEPMLQFLAGVLPLFTFQYPLGTRQALLSTCLGQLVDAVARESDGRVDVLCLSVFVLLGGLSERHLAQFVDERTADLTTVANYLVKLDDPNIQMFSIKLVEHLYHVRLGASDADNLVLSVIDSEAQIPEPLVEFLTSSICRYPGVLLPRVLERLREGAGEEEGDARTENSLLILKKVLSRSPDLVANDPETSGEIMEILVPFLGEAAATRAQVAALLKYLDTETAMKRLLPLMFAEDARVANGAVGGFVALFEKKEAIRDLFQDYVDILSGDIQIERGYTKSKELNPSDIYAIDEDEQVEMTPLTDKQLDRLLDLLPRLAETIKRVNGDWKSVLEVLQIKVYSNSKDTRLSKVLPVLIQHVDRDVVAGYLLPSVLAKLKSQQDLFATLEGHSIETEEDAQYIFKLLMPMLILKVTLKSVYSDLEGASPLVEGLYQQLRLRIFNSHLILQIRKLASDAVSYLPCSIWSQPFVEDLNKRVKALSDDSAADSALVDIKLMLFGFCNGYLAQGKNLHSANRPLLAIIDSLLPEPASPQIANEEERSKLNMALSDAIAFMIKSSINKTTPPLPITGAQLSKTPLASLSDISSASDIMPLIFKTIIHKSRYHLVSEIILMNSLTTVVRLLEGIELHTFTKITFPSLIKVYFAPGVDPRLKVSAIQVLFSAIYKLSDYQIEEYHIDLFDLCESAIKSPDALLKLSGLKLLASLMNAIPQRLFQSIDSTQTIHALLQRHATLDQNADVRQLAASLLNLFT